MGVLRQGQAGGRPGPAPQDHRVQPVLQGEQQVEDDQRQGDRGDRHASDRGDGRRLARRQDAAAARPQHAPGQGRHARPKDRPEHQVVAERGQAQAGQGLGDHRIGGGEQGQEDRAADHRQGQQRREPPPVPGPGRPPRLARPGQVQPRPDQSHRRLGDQPLAPAPGVVEAGGAGQQHHEAQRRPEQQPGQRAGRRRPARSPAGRRRVVGDRTPAGTRQARTHADHHAHWSTAARTARHHQVENNASARQSIGGAGDEAGNWRQQQRGNLTRAPLCGAGVGPCCCWPR